MGFGLKVASVEALVAGETARGQEADGGYDPVEATAAGAMNGRAMAAGTGQVGRDPKVCGDFSGCLRRASLRRDSSR